MKAAFPFIGYHGCDKTTAQKVLSGCEGLTESSAESEWLGSGIYFWNNDPKRALEWAKYRKFKNPYVLGALIIPANLLDFATREPAPLVEYAYKFIASGAVSENKQLPKNRPASKGDSFYKNRQLDCEVMNALHYLTEKAYDVFSAPFLEGNPIYDKGFFLKETHVQLCVKDPSAIVGYFLPSSIHELGLEGF